MTRVMPRKSSTSRARWRLREEAARVRHRPVYSFDATETEPPNTNSFFGNYGFAMWVSDNTQQKIRGCVTIPSGPRLGRVALHRHEVRVDGLPFPTGQLSQHALGRHGRTCSGHPRLLLSPRRGYPGHAPGMTALWCGGAFARHAISRIQLSNSHCSSDMRHHPHCLRRGAPSSFAFPPPCERACGTPGARCTLGPDANAVFRN